MLFFVDESGNPHPKDATLRPVLLAVGYPEAEARNLARQLFRIKQNFFGEINAWTESKLKAHRVLNERTLRHQPQKWQYVEAVFDLCNSFPLTTFAIVMERPTLPSAGNPKFLPPQYFYLLQRVHNFTSDLSPAQYALVIFDSRDPTQDTRLSEQFSNFLHRSAFGRKFDRIIDTALFVDSRITPGIQIADLFASCVRQYHQSVRNQERSVSPSYAAALNRLYREVQRTSPRGVEDDEGRELYPEYHLSAEKIEQWGLPEESSEEPADSPESPTPPTT